MVYVGTCDDEVGGVLVQRLMEATEEELNHTASRFLCLGLGLLYLGKQERADVMLEAVRTVEHKRGRYAEITLNTCAYAGTGNVLKVQEMLRICAEHLTEDAEHQSVAVLGIALIVLGEDVGTEMSLRSFDHLLHYGELPVKRVVPLALAMLYISNPDYQVIDQLSRMSHDQDAELAQGAILGLGLVSAGSNNSRVAGLLRQLSEFYAKEASHLFVVRIAQGLNALGKGLIGLGPFSSDRLLMNGPAVAGLLTLFHACLDLKGTLLDKMHYLLFFATTAMNPRFMSTVDEDLNPVSASVRVGQAVETVGQAGRPKTITGFQTHTTPVLLGYRDRAELAGQEYSTLVSVMEGVVIVEKIPETPTQT
jgi:26S proteasome regulatory subunit N1